MVSGGTGDAVEPVVRGVAVVRGAVDVPDPDVVGFF
jgi:hypothetical protein